MILRRHNTRGIAERTAFSLLELVLVIAIIGVLTMIAAPRFGNSMLRYRLDAATERVIADFTFARKQARTRSANVTMTFDLGSHRYTLAEIADLNRSGNPYTVPLAISPYEVKITAADFGGDTEIVFGGHGLPDTGGSVTLRSGDTSRTITIDAAGAVSTLDVLVVPL